MDPDLTWLHYLGGVLFLVVSCVFVARRGTLLFGLSTHNVFMVASATLSGFFFGTVLDEPLDTFTPEHVAVLSYAIAGLLAMVAGISIAWKRMPPAGRYGEPGFPFAHASHINEKIGWLTFCVGAAADLLYPLVRTVPTFSTAVHCVSTLARIGL